MEREAKTIDDRFIHNGHPNPNGNLHDQVLKNQ